MSPPELCFEALTSAEAACGTGPQGGRRGQTGRGSSRKRKIDLSPSPPFAWRRDHGTTQHGGHLQARKSSRARNQRGETCDLRPLASRLPHCLSPGSNEHNVSLSSYNLSLNAGCLKQPEHTSCSRTGRGGSSVHDEGLISKKLSEAKPEGTVKCV